MKRIILVLSAALCLASANLLAADAKNYQVTGPVLEVNPTYIIVQHGQAKLEIVCDKATLGDVKVGDEVRIRYQMVATVVGVKTDR